MKKVVVMGGGNGSFITLSALKKYSDELQLSSVVSMCDSGGSTGALRRELSVLPPGDIMRAVLALSKYNSDVLKQIFYKNRLSSLENINKKYDASRGHNLGNLFLSLVSKEEGDYVATVRALEEAVEAVGTVYPASLDMADLVAELESGDIIKTEEKICEPDYGRDSKIKKVWLEPVAKVYEPVIDVIKQADYIFLGPGDLYTSIIASLLANGIKEAIQQSNAKLIYIVGNAYHADGECGPEKLSDFIGQLQNYLPRKIDVVVSNNAELNEEQKQKYKNRGWNPVEFDKENLGDYNVVAGDWEKEEGGLDSSKLGNILKTLII